MKSAARRKEGRNRHLVAADQRGETAAGHRPDGGHRSPRLQHRATPGQEVFPESGEVRRVSFAPGADHEIPRRLVLLQLAPPDLADPPAQTIAGHRGRLKSGNDQSHPRVARLVIRPDHLQMPEPAAPALGEAAANVGGAREPMSSW